MSDITLSKQQIFVFARSSHTLPGNAHGRSKDEIR